MPTVWNERTAPRLNFDLTDEIPMKAAVHTYLQRQDFKSDMHFELELGIVERGRMERQYDGYDMTCGPGQVWFCGIWEPHRYRVVSAPCRVHVMVIRPQMLAGLSFPEAPSYKWLLPFTVAPRQRPQPDRALKKSVLQWAKRMEHASASDPRRRGLVQRVMLLELLLMLSENWRPAETSERPSGHYVRVNRAVQFVFENPVGLTASRAAKLSGLSRNHFNRVFDETMGLSFAKFSLRYRLSGAARQVVGSDDPLKSIAAQWGFTDASHLLRCFRQHYGCTPKAYRQERAAGASAL